MMKRSNITNLSGQTLEAAKAMSSSIEGPFTPAEPTPELLLPNLRCRDIQALGENTQWRIEVTVENVGEASSRKQCEVLAILSMSSTTGQYLGVAPCPALDPGASQVVVFSPIPGVNLYDLTFVRVIVDPPTLGRVGGKVWESDATDNICEQSLNLVPSDPHPPKDPEEPAEEGGSDPWPPI